MTIEMPWVVETRLEPGQKRKRNRAWGVAAGILALVNAVLFVITILVVVLLPPVFNLMLALAGIVTLAALGCSIAAIAKRGGFNSVVGWISLVLVVLTNPLIPLVTLMLFIDFGA